MKGSFRTAEMIPLDPDFLQFQSQFHSWDSSALVCRIVFFPVTEGNLSLRGNFRNPGNYLDWLSIKLIMILVLLFTVAMFCSLGSLVNRL